MLVTSMPAFFFSSAWGESFFIAIQNVVILFLMFHYNSHRMYLAIFAPVYGVGVWYLTSSFVSIELLSTLQACVIPLMVISRVRLSISATVHYTVLCMSMLVVRHGLEGNYCHCYNSFVTCLGMESLVIYELCATCLVDETPSPLNYELTFTSLCGHITTVYTLNHY